MYLLTEITSFLGDIGFDGPIEGMQPLTQWERPTAFRLFFGPGSSPRSLIVKHISGFEKTSVAEQWGPRWKVAQDYVNLGFVNDISDGAFTPRVYGYSEQLNMLAIEDLGDISLHGTEQIPGIGTNEVLWKTVARTLARLITSCPRDPDRFEQEAHGRLEAFAILRKWDDQNPDDCHSIVGVARETGFGKVDQLGEEVLRLQNAAAQDNGWIGYSVGDLWHQHVMLRDGCVKFIDFHCGGYDIACTDLMRLLEGTPLYQDSPLPPELVAACKHAFFDEFSKVGREEASREAFEEAYDFCLLRHVSFMFAREIIQLRRSHLRSLVAKAVRAARDSLQNSQRVGEVALELLEGLASLPDQQ